MNQNYIIFDINLGYHLTRSKSTRLKKQNTKENLSITSSDVDQNKRHSDSFTVIQFDGYEIQPKKLNEQKKLIVTNAYLSKHYTNQNSNGQQEMWPKLRITAEGSVYSNVRRRLKPF